MPSNPSLEKRIQRIADRTDLVYRYFFGGPAWFLNGHFCVGIYGEDLVVRVGEEAANKLLATNDHTRPMDVTGKPMRGWLFIDGGGCKTPRQVGVWVERAVGFVSQLPAKPTTKRAAKKKSALKNTKRAVKKKTAKSKVKKTSGSKRRA